MRLMRNKDISIVWTCFLMKIVGLWMATDLAQQRRRNFALIYTVGAIFIATCIAIRDFYFSWGNFNDCVYIACNILYLMIVFFKIAVLYVHRMEFYDLVAFTEKNFWHSNYDIQEKLILDNCKRICAIFIVVLSFCAQGTCAGYMVTPLLANVGKNESERALPFNMWVDFPTAMSPYFETLFIIQILCVYHVGVCYICFDNFLCLLNLHVASQFRILQHRLKSLNYIVQMNIDVPVSDKGRLSYTDTCYSKLRRCVRQHQALTEYCKNLEDIFTMIVLGQVLFLDMIICLVGYQIFLSDSPPSRNVSLVLNMAGTLCQLFMFTYSCDGLIRQSTDIGPAIFSGPWATLPMNKTGRSLRKNIIIIIMRSTRACHLTANGFCTVSLETYTGVLSTAMSYFTLLRQVYSLRRDSKSS
ncbi:odorant receptor 13a-like [Andrena cerasifolii]|uniref:odorant receptor 13a-like n=1 Tax=Andrena cerasifolii TaxID=2819439 RepID=UPI0040380776